MFRLKALLEEHLDELSEPLVREHGKTLAEARGELRRGIGNVEVACGIPSMMRAGSVANAAPGLDDGVDIGALIAPEHVQTVRNYVETGVQEGAELLYDGRDVTVEGYEGGNFLGPTVFGDVTEDMVIALEEIFGLVLALARVADLDVAIDRLNGSDFGNAASLFTGAGADARRFRHEADVGNLGVNVGTSAPMAFFHFGGAKDSFFGDLHAQGEDVIRLYTDERVSIERWPDA